MIFERIKSKGLAHNSYFLGRENEAVIIDPRRDCQAYLDLAAEHGMTITHIFETHRNEDYVIGSRELQNITNAKIYHGPGIEWGFGNTLEDGQQFRINDLLLRVIHTPGHTIESVSYAVSLAPDENSPIMVFTGDTLFVRDVGRIDLYGRDRMPEMSAMLFDSLHQKLLPLGDSVIIRPAHGAGSVCGHAIADWDESTIGQERLHNPALQITDKDKFIQYKLEEKLQTPPYFTKMEALNQAGPPLLNHLPLPPALSVSEFKGKMDAGAIVVDTNMPATFGGAHIPGAFSIWLGGLATFAGWFLPYDRPILLVLDDQCRVDQAVRYLIRLGFDHIAGYLKGGTEAWYNAGMPTECLPLLTVHELKKRLDRGEDLTLLDVRDENEYASGHIKGSVNIYVGKLPGRLNEIPKDKPVAVLCSVGRRASIGAGILKRTGWPVVHTVLGSMSAWQAAGFPVAEEQAATAAR